MKNNKKIFKKLFIYLLESILEIYDNEINGCWVQTTPFGA